MGNCFKKQRNNKNKKTQVKKSAQIAESPAYYLKHIVVMLRLVSLTKDPYAILDDITEENATGACGDFMDHLLYKFYHDADKPEWDPLTLNRYFLRRNDACNAQTFYLELSTSRSSSLTSFLRRFKAKAVSSVKQNPSIQGPENVKKALKTFSKKCREESDPWNTLKFKAALRQADLTEEDFLLYLSEKLDLEEY